MARDRAYDTDHFEARAAKDTLLGGKPLTRLEAMVLLGVANLPAVISRALALPKSANRQRATTQPPQGVDATHGSSELFPVSESVSRQ